MKFGQELRASIVQAWKSHYCRYEEIKAHIKELRKLYEAHNISIEDDDTSVACGDASSNANMCQIKVIKTDTTMACMEYDAAHTQFTSNMDALKKYQTAIVSDQALHSMIELVGEDGTRPSTATQPQPEHKHTEHDAGVRAHDMDSTNNNNNKQSPPAANVYRFNRVTKVIVPDLCSKVPRLKASLYDIEAKETEIALLLQKDIFKVSTFYARQCRYFAEQHNALIIRVKLMLENEQKLKHATQSNMRDDIDNKEDATPERRGLLTGSYDASAVPMANIARRKTTSMSDSDSGVDTLVEDDDDGPVNGGNADDDMRRMRLRPLSKQERLSAKEILEEKSVLRLLMRQTYNAVGMLEKYRKINEMAFNKITKKHDKNSAFARNLRVNTMQFIRSECNFGNNYLTEFLKKRLECVYALYLKTSESQKKSEAIQRLKRPPSKKEIQTESCVIGLCGGWSLSLLLIAAILVITEQTSFWLSQQTYRAWYMFQASMTMTVYLWFWGCDLWVFQKYQFNHGFIFGADPTTLLRVPHVWNIAAIFSVSTMLLTMLYVLAFKYPFMFSVDPEIFAMLALLCWLLYVCVPFPWVKYTKRFLFKSIVKQVVSPLSTVEFTDFFLADQWTSLFTLVVDLAFSFCYLFTGDFLLSGDEISQCDSRGTRAWLSVLRAMPYWIRFWQCIRRAYDQRSNAMAHAPNKYRVRRHLANAVKYSLAVIVVFVNAAYVYFNSTGTQIAAVLVGAVTTLYAYAWDLYYDWGLLRWNANEEHKLLREEITYPAVAYYAAMITNFVLRISWAISLYPASFGITDMFLMHYIRLLLNVAEVLRRCLWNVFRIENEHLNNCGEFRVVKDIPIAQDYAQSIKIEGDGDTDDYGSYSGRLSHHRDQSRATAQNERIRPYPSATTSSTISEQDENMHVGVYANHKIQVIQQQQQHVIQEEQPPPPAAAAVVALEASSAPEPPPAIAVAHGASECKTDILPTQTQPIKHAIANDGEASTTPKPLKRNVIICRPAPPPKTVNEMQIMEQRRHSSPSSASQSSSSEFDSECTSETQIRRRPSPNRRNVDNPNNMPANAAMPANNTDHPRLHNDKSRMSVSGRYKKAATGSALSKTKKKKKKKHSSKKHNKGDDVVYQKLEEKNQKFVRTRGKLGQNRVDAEVTYLQDSEVSDSEQQQIKDQSYTDKTWPKRQWKTKPNPNRRASEYSAKLGDEATVPLKKRQRMNGANRSSTTTTGSTECSTSPPVTTEIIFKKKSDNKEPEPEGEAEAEARTPMPIPLLTQENLQKFEDDVSGNTNTKTKSRKSKKKDSSAADMGKTNGGKIVYRLKEEDTDNADKR